MNWNSLRGHRDQIRMLRRSLQRGRLAHAYLFAGPPGVGKSRFARIFAQCLLCERYGNAEVETCDECTSCRQAVAGTHPDLFMISCQEGKTEIPVEVFVGKKEERGRSGLIHDLSLRPMEADRRIAIIDDANTMNEEGANAMLKTLEEPPPNSILILVADNLDGLLPTIRSRCQLIRFTELSEQDVAELLLEHELATSSAEASAAAAMSGGSMQLAAQLLHPEMRALREQLDQFLASDDLNPFAAAKVLLEGLDAIGSETAQQRRNIGWLLRFAQEFYRQALLWLTHAERPIATASGEVRGFCDRQRKLGTAGLELTMELFERVVQAELHVAANVAPTRIVEVLLEDLARISRSRATTIHA